MINNLTIISICMDTVKGEGWRVNIPEANLRPKILSFLSFILSKQSTPLWELITSRMHMIHSNFRTMSDKWCPLYDPRFFKHWNNSPNPSNWRNSVIQSTSLDLIHFLNLTKFWRLGLRSHERKLKASILISSSSSRLSISLPTMKPSDRCLWARFCFLLLAKRLVFSSLDLSPSPRFLKLMLMNIFNPNVPFFLQNVKILWKYNYILSWSLWILITNLNIYTMYIICIST